MNGIKPKLVYCNSDAEWTEIVTGNRGVMVRVVMEYTGELPDIEYVLMTRSGLFGYMHTRTDGPAKIFLHSNLVVFYIRDCRYTDTRSFCKAAEMSDEDTFMWLLKYGDKLPTTCKEYYGEQWRNMDLEDF